MFVIKYRKIFYWISGALVGLSILSLLFWSLNFGIDFTGGSLLEVSYTSARPDMPSIQTVLNQLNLGQYSIRPVGNDGYILRTRTLSEAERQTVVSTMSLNNQANMSVKQFNTIGPILGDELRGKAILSIILVIIAIVLFITFAFRKVSEPVSSWKYGLVAVVALVHDVIVPTGFFSILGHFAGFEVDTLFVTAILVILGFSVHDTIVVFDRTRENLKHNGEGGPRKSFEEIVGMSVSQTFTRSINTSLTVVLSLIVLYFLGAEATRNFALVMLVGIIAGTYSSIFLGSPLLVTLEKWQNRKR
ncbi:MAG TPA: protein translocase subunit SecF [Candidatus Paceibacterota bacterium]|nr:protein translocase subunit SecF [Candidatus Paceibacterota bacterium]